MFLMRIHKQYSILTRLWTDSGSSSLLLQFPVPCKRFQKILEQTSSDQSALRPAEVNPCVEGASLSSLAPPRQLTLYVVTIDIGSDKAFSALISGFEIETTSCQRVSINPIVSLTGYSQLSSHSIFTNG